MNSFFPLLLLFLFSLVPFARSEPISTAVLDFKASGDFDEKSGGEIATLLSAKLAADPSILLVERQELDKLLGEHELGATGAEAHPSQFGQMVGAQTFVTGRAFSINKTEYLVAKVMSVETGRVFGELVEFPAMDGLPRAVDQLAGKLAVILNKRQGDLLAKPDSLEAELVALKKSLSGKRLPSVSVVIPERQIGVAVPDPAAQTAILHTLAQLGFTVVDPATSSQVPDVAITGEAFSELGLRKGSLVACKSRVEVKVTQKRSGALLFTDSQTAVAFDVGESSTGKTALEKAAVRLLERIVPVLPAAAAK